MPEPIVLASIIPGIPFSPNERSRQPEIFPAPDSSDVVVMLADWKRFELEYNPRWYYFDSLEKIPDTGEEPPISTALKMARASDPTKDTILLVLPPFEETLVRHLILLANATLSSRHRDSLKNFLAQEPPDFELKAVGNNQSLRNLSLRRSVARGLKDMAFEPGEKAVHEEPNSQAVKRPCTVVRVRPNLLVLQEYGGGDFATGYETVTLPSLEECSFRQKSLMASVFVAQKLFDLCEKFSLDFSLDIF